MKRVFLFVITNIAVIAMLTLVTNLILSLFGTSVEAVFGQRYSHLLVMSIVYGFGGSLISLLLSKPMAKMSTKAKTIDGSEGDAERWLVATVEDLARRAGLKTPEVAIYPGEPNAFATGAFRNSALVAVSTGILGSMSRDELKAVLGHEMSHVANGDMVTMCLCQGVLNAFVILFSRILASVIEGAVSGDRRNRRSSGGILYWVVVHVLQIALGVLASLITCAYSRRREYAADAGSARLLGSPSPMIAALRRLGGIEAGALPDSLKAFGVASAKKTSLFATHPAIEARVEALQNLPPDFMNL